MGSLAIASFCFFLLLFVGVGVYSARRKTSTTEDYLVASRNVNPWLAALSAVSTNNSGFMFMGLIGSAYAGGVSSAWLMIGWIGGDWIAWFFVHKRLREKSEEQGATSIPGFLAGAGSRIGTGSRAIAILGGLIILVFLSVYASAQLVAGGKALAAVSDVDFKLGALIGAVMVAAYCFAGGIRASIWTDAVQSVVMIGAMVGVYLIAVYKLGGHGAMWDALAAIDNGDGPGLTEWAPSGFQFGIVGYVLGWFGAGFGAVGQPHVMIRAMAVDSPESVAKMRRIYVVWYSLFALACIGVGMAARLLLTGPEFSLVGAAPYDSELALLDLVTVIDVSDILIGLTLAGLFAATISTADSQILACSAALTQDIFPKAGSSYALVKGATLLVTACALGFALVGGSVFKLATLAWSTLASGLGPLMVIRSLGLKVTTPVALAMMLCGLAASLIWLYGLQFSGGMYEVLPGMVIGFAVYGAWRLVSR